MSTDPLAVYLNDHLAGSVAALRLIETLAELVRGHPLEEKLHALRAEVTQDQQTLREIMTRIEADENRLKQAAAWLTEKASEGKLALAGRSHPALALLQGLESLALGLQGKLSLLRVLGELAPRDPRLAGYPFASLEARTTTQLATVERERMAAARAAFEGAPSAETPKP